MCDHDGKNLLRLTNFQGPTVGSPSWSPDGKWIAFDSREEGQDVYVISQQGTGIRKLTSHPGGDDDSEFSRDGKWIYFTSHRSGEPQVWKIPFEGGEAVQVTQQGGGEAHESFDGELIYYKFNDTIWQKPVGGGEETQVFDTPLRPGVFSVTAEGIYVLPREPLGISFYDFTTKTVSSVICNDRLIGWGFSASADGLRILYTQEEYADTDLMLVEDFN